MYEHSLSTIFCIGSCMKMSIDSDWSWKKYLMSGQLKYAPDSARWALNDVRENDWLGNTCLTLKLLHIYIFLWYYYFLYTYFILNQCSLFILSKTIKNRGFLRCSGVRRTSSRSRFRYLIFLVQVLKIFLYAWRTTSNFSWFQ